MTEAQWLACSEPGQMLAFARLAEYHPARRPTPRKFRLAGCACCRAIWALLPDESDRQAVEVAERCADGQADTADLHRACGRAVSSAAVVCLRDPGAAAQNAAWLALKMRAAPRKANWPVALEQAATRIAAAGNMGVAARVVRKAARSRLRRAEAEASAHDRLEVCDLLRDVLGNLHRPAVTAPSWAEAGAGRVLAIAESIYNDRSFAELPVLADALEDAGCADEAFLGHLRGLGPHARGCWALDALLGKE
jgi:hypothetical protein